MLVADLEKTGRLRCDLVITDIERWRFEVAPFICHDGSFQLRAVIGQCLPAVRRFRF